jgi:hypothetical protein
LLVVVEGVTHQSVTITEQVEALVVIVLLLGHQGVAHLLKPLCHCVLEPHIP